MSTICIFRHCQPEFLKDLNHTLSKTRKRDAFARRQTRKTVNHRRRAVFSEFAACVMSVLRWLVMICAMPEDDTRELHGRILSHVRRHKKPDKRDRRTGVTARWSDSIRSDRICIATPITDCEPDFNYDCLSAIEGIPRFHRSTYSFTAYVHHAT